MNRNVGAGVRRWCGIVAVIVAAVMLMSPPASAAPGGSGGCNLALSGGLQANDLCWLDMSNFNIVQAVSAGGQAMSFPLGSGYTLTMTVHTNRKLTANPLPTAANSYVGNAAYAGVPYKPALMLSEPVTALLDLTDITVTDAGNNPVSAFEFVSVDAEVLDPGDSLRFISDVALSPIYTSTSGYGYCTTTLSGIGTTMVVCSGSSGSSGPGALALRAHYPSKIDISMGAAPTSASRVAVAFAVQVPQLQTPLVAGSVPAGLALTALIAACAWYLIARRRRHRAT